MLLARRGGQSFQGGQDQLPKLADRGYIDLLIGGMRSVDCWAKAHLSGVGRGGTRANKATTKKGRRVAHERNNTCSYYIPGIREESGDVERGFVREVADSLLLGVAGYAIE